MSVFTQRSTWWLVTAYTDNIERIQNAKLFPPSVKLVRGQLEKCPTTDKLHFQGAVQCFGQQRATFFRDWLPGIHFEKAKNIEAVKKYCVKSKTRVADPVEITNPDDYMTMDRGMMRLAEMSFTMDSDPTAEEYWELVNEVIKESPRFISMFASPVFRTTWVQTRRTWRALVLQARNNEEDLTDEIIIPADSTSNYAHETSFSSPSQDGPQGSEVSTDSEC